jgi:hypothetical protein
MEATFAYLKRFWSWPHGFGRGSQNVSNFVFKKEHWESRTEEYRKVSELHKSPLSFVSRRREHEDPRRVNEPREKALVWSECRLRAESCFSITLQACRAKNKWKDTSGFKIHAWSKSTNYQFIFARALTPVQPALKGRNLMISIWKVVHLAILSLSSKSLSFCSAGLICC